MITSPNCLRSTTSICALNSWHARPAHTFTSHTGVSQIDYIITRIFRLRDGGKPGTCPCKHRYRSIHWRPGTQARLSPKVDKARLVQAAATGNGDALALQALVASQLRDVSTDDPHALHARVNAVLLQCAQEVFPSSRAPDNRISAQAPFQLLARHTWRLYALLRPPRVATVAAMLHKWKLHVAFARASKALRP